MAAIHVLDSPQAGVYNLVCHFATPAGTNAHGVSWKDIVLAAYPNEEPTAYSDEAERLDIIAGDIVEVASQIGLEPDEMSGPALQAALNSHANLAKADWLKEAQRRFKHYGYEQGTVS